MAIVREMENEVGYQALAIVSSKSFAALVAKSFLGVKLLALLQLEVFEQLLQLQLAEVALHLHLASKRTGEAVGSFAQFLALLHINLYGGIETSKSFALLVLGFVESLLHSL